VWKNQKLSKLYQRINSTQDWLQSPPSEQSKYQWA
jgi:hypothetical protein